MSKKSKIVNMSSPETYIKTRARTLPLYKSFILSDWKETGLANIVVSRQHSNQNVTFGIYLVDLYCLGIKDTFFGFNTDEHALWDIVDTYGLEEIDYTLAHNIVYGAVGYADDLGFKPHKDWKLTQKILEEDDDRVPLIEIAFGCDNVPVYVQGLNDSPAQIKNILATLEKSTGGNFRFISEDDEDDTDSFDDELFDPGDFERIINGEQEPSAHQLFAISVATLLANGNIHPSALDLDRVASAADMFFDDDTIYVADEYLDEQILALENNCVGKDLSDLDFLALTKETHPENPLPYLLTLIELYRTNKKEEAADIQQQISEKFPDLLYAHLLAAQHKLDSGNLEEAFAMVDGKYYIDETFPNRDRFSSGEFILYYGFMANYTFLTGDMMAAIAYAKQIRVESNYIEEAEAAIYALTVRINESLKSEDTL